jgi:hypothetical protein
MVKINDMIESLTKIRDEYGNLPILLEVQGFGGRSGYLCNGLRYEEGYPDDDLDELSDDENDFLRNSPKTSKGNTKVITISGCNAIYHI